MKIFTQFKLVAFILAIVFSVTITIAQVPQKMSYQSVIRNSSGTLVTNQLVGIKISILQGSTSGNVVYTETQTAITNANGLVSLQIGGGTVVTGSFATINWATGVYYIKTETDPNGGANYSIAGTTQLLSVAYALYAANSGTPGVKGDSGISIRTSKVIGDSLFVTLSTGQTINAGNVRGATGLQGIQGIQGIKGNKGDTGVQGLTGVQGIQGIQGLKGDKGDTGLQGIQGLTGSTGAKGDSGISIRTSKVIGDSLYITMSTGQTINVGYVRGATGLQGIQGIQGIKGNKGDTGVQGLTGVQGIQGIQGLKGDKGDTGLQGIQGLTGSTGAKGDSGISIRTSKVIGDSLYITLSTGQTINVGYVRGLTGATGIQGQQGVQGIQGAKGDSGISVRTSKVIGDSLLVTLSTGKIVNVGNVRGIQGLKGDTGVSVRNTKVNGDSLYITLSNGQTLNAGNVRGLTGFLSLVGKNKGDMLFWNGSNWDTLPVGNPKQYLQLNDNNIPVWSGATYPSVTTNNVSAITTKTVVYSGVVNDSGGASITARGICWSTSNKPSIISSNITNNGIGIGSFTNTLTGLLPATTYYIRAYATNSAGTKYGSEISFTTSTITIPTINTVMVSSVTPVSAATGGNITNNGGDVIISRGVCWNTVHNPTIALGTYTNDGTGTGSFVSNITGLTAGTTYYVRAYATNSAGTSYGNEDTLTTLAFALRQSFGGGVIFFIDNSGQHGLIASTSNQSTNHEWAQGNGAESVTTNANGTAIGTGSSNTNKIISVLSSINTTNAAQICRNYNGGGYNDWFLPSMYELLQMYSQKAIVGISNSVYWSSTEGNPSTPPGTYGAWNIDFSSGSLILGYKTFSQGNIRAIRSF